MGGWIFLLALVFAPSLHATYQQGTSPLALQDIKDLLAQPRPAETLEDFLDQLRKHSPDFFDNFILMYRSRSFQASSETQPRVIAYNSDASFVLTYNGSPEQRGFDRLEMMQFDSQENRFAFYEITKQDGRLHLSAPNPSLCLSCHQTSQRREADPRPNWEPYSRWPGAIGSEEGRFSETFQSEIYLPEDEVHRASARREDEILNTFREGEGKTNPRYKFLDLSNRAKLVAQTSNFTNLLGKLNFRRMMRLVQSDAPEHFKKVDQILAAAMTCRGLYVSAPVLEQVETWAPGDREHFVTDPSELLRSRRKGPYEVDSLDDLGQRTRELYYPSPFPMPTISELVYVLFDRFGVDTTDWAMDFRTGGRLAFRERFGIPADPEAEAQSAYGIIFKGAPTDCDQLKKASLQQGENLLSLPIFPKSPPRPLIESCVRCHTSYASDAPAISFDSPERLRVELASYKTKSGRPLMAEIEYRMSDHATLEEQMPRSLVRPSRDERLQLIGYLKQIESEGLWQDFWLHF